MDPNGKDTSDDKDTLDPTLEYAKFEYDFLRQELIHSGTLAIQLLVGALIVMGTLMGFGLTKDPPFATARPMIFVFASYVALIGMFFAIDRRLAAHTIAVYLRLFVETKVPNVRWETQLYEFRKRRPKPTRFEAFTENQLIIYWVFFAINIALALGFIIAELTNWCQDTSRNDGLWGLLPHSIADLVLYLSIALVLLVLWVAWRTKDRYREMTDCIDPGKNPRGEILYESTWCDMLKEIDPKAWEATSCNTETKDKPPANQQA